jgi:tetratricopeptide (TPR) repeat protein
VGHETDEAWIWSGLALCAYAMYDNATAQHYGREVIRMAQANNEHSREGDGWLFLGHAHLGLREYAAALAAYQASLGIWHELGMANRALESQAGIAQVYHQQGQAAQALAVVHAIHSNLSPQTITGMDEPFRVYHTCYQVLAASGDARAQTVLHEAATLLHARAATIDETRLRYSYLTYVAPHRALLAAWQQL